MSDFYHKIYEKIQCVDAHKLVQQFILNSFSKTNLHIFHVPKNASNEALARSKKEGRTYLNQCHMIQWFYARITTQYDRLESEFVRRLKRLDARFKLSTPTFSFAKIEAFSNFEIKMYATLTIQLERCSFNLSLAIAKRLFELI